MEKKRGSVSRLSHGTPGSMTGPEYSCRLSRGVGRLLEIAGIIISLEPFVFIRRIMYLSCTQIRRVGFGGRRIESGSL